ncbi:hypothetical protein NSPZN2_10652 [Nitrospira defluvii]|uniref:Uncharacterized protein n=1 Tax=Nitrospira defluvii TaxID=330214 RepID=A0ABM8QIT0_9BACT|nr:hypothetical protein NSPZN2_10652 [Nitrospira defluvii]
MIRALRLLLLSGRCDRQEYRAWCRDGVRTDFRPAPWKGGISMSGVRRRVVAMVGLISLLACNGGTFAADASEAVADDEGLIRREEALREQLNSPWRMNHGRHERTGGVRRDRPLDRAEPVGGGRGDRAVVVLPADRCACVPVAGCL